MPSPVGEVVDIVGWIDGIRVLLAVAEGDLLRLFRWSLADDRFERLPLALTSGARLSADGRWLVCQCGRDTNESRTWTVMPADDPAAGRPIAGLGRLLAWAWEPVARTAAAAQVLLQRREVELSPGTHYAPAVLVADAEGIRIPLPPHALHWTSSAPTVAAVDSLTGRVRAHEPGRATIMVELGGVARDSLLVSVGVDTAVTILREDWVRLDSTRWLDFGVPPPGIVTHADGTRGLNNGGDGSYPSGLYWATPFVVQQGYGLEASVAVPVSQSQWQQQTLAVVSTRSLVVDRWDRRAGAARNDPDYLVEQCGITYPAGEGLTALGQVGLNAAGTNRNAPVDSTWPAGAWHTVRIQLFPDGTCGFAFDGMPIWRSEARVRLDVPYRIWLKGNSAGTDRIMVGPLTMWRGVRTDVDWELLDGK